jgi:hypothetical protein
MLATLAEARAAGMQACFIRSSATASESLLAITSDDVPIVHGERFARARWRMSAAAQRWSERWRDGRASFWHELGREVRQYAGDERLPADLRARVRELSQRALTKSSDAVPVVPYPRRRLRGRVSTSLPPALIDEARAAASARGVALDAPIVAVDTRLEAETLTEATAFLAQQGYAVVGVDHAASVFDVFILSIARFAICASFELQQMAYLTNTPSLRLNAPDPFIGYPVREDGLFTLQTVIDLDDGRELTTRELLMESYFRNVRNCGYRGNTAAEVRRAVQEMHEGVTRGWRDSEGQAAFRAQVVEAGSNLAARVRYVAQWGPDRGYVGDGRLVRFQANEA